MPMKVQGSALRRVLSVVAALFAIAWVFEPVLAAEAPKPKKLQQITAADRKAAAKRAAAKGVKPGVAGVKHKAPPAAPRAGGAKKEVAP
jgi:hypothetical protein